MAEEIQVYNFLDYAFDVSPSAANKLLGETLAENSALWNVLKVMKIDSMVYEYKYEVEKSPTSNRGINENFAATKGKKGKARIELGIFGGAAEADSALNWEYLLYQDMLSKIEFLSDDFVHQFFKGDRVANEKQIDGLDVQMPLSQVNATYEGSVITLEMISELKRKVKGTNKIIAMNDLMFGKIEDIGREQIKYTKDSFGYELATIGDAKVVVVTDDVIPWDSGKSDIYCFSMSETGTFVVANGGITPTIEEPEKIKEQYRQAVQFKAGVVSVPRSAARLYGVKRAA